MISNKNKIVIVSAITLCLCIAISIFVIIPTLNDIKTMYENIEKQKAELEKKFQRGQFMKKIVSNYKEIEPSRPRLESIFVATGEELKFITDLEKVAQKHNIAEPDFSKIPTKDDPNSKNDVLKKLPLEINLYQDYTEILGFINDLDLLNYYFNASSIMIESSKSKGLGVNIKIIGEAYFK